jgi:hypothetical protein
MEISNTNQVNGYSLESHRFRFLAFAQPYRLGMTKGHAQPYRLRLRRTQRTLSFRGVSHRICHSEARACAEARNPRRAGWCAGSAYRFRFLALTQTHRLGMTKGSH